MLNYLKKINENKFLKNLTTLFIGSSLAQIIPLIFYPLMTRIYTPADFGLFAYISAISAVLVTFATGKYEMSILISKTKTIWPGKRILYFERSPPRCGTLREPGS